MASFFCLLHAYQLRERQRDLTAVTSITEAQRLGSVCYSWGGDLLVIGIIANYACVAADTFSSELGILSKSQPRLITSLTFRKVPRGTNGGVTLLGLGAGLLGSIVVVTSAMLFLPFCSSDTAEGVGGGIAWTDGQRRVLILGLTIWGALGSVVDSVLGGLFQRSVKDVRSGKIVEGEGGVRVLTSTDTPAGAEHMDALAGAKAAALSGEGKKAIEKPDASGSETKATDKASKYNPKDKHRRPSFGDEKPSRIVENGWDLLDNNDVNFLMAFIMSIGAMAIASWYWNVPFQTIFASIAPADTPAATPAA